MAANEVEFPLTRCHESHIATLTLTNFSPQHPLVIQDIRISNLRLQPASPSTSPPPFSLAMSPILPLTLAPQHQAHVSVHFHPVQAGEYSADLAFLASSKDFAQFTQNIALRATATTQVGKPTSLSPPPPSHVESEELKILRRMEESFRMYQEDTKRQLELLHARIGHLEAALSAPSSASTSSLYPVAHLQRSGTGHHHQPTASTSRRHHSDPPHHPRWAFGETRGVNSLSAVPFPDLEPSFSVSTALSPPSQGSHPSATTSPAPSDSFHRAPRTLVKQGDRRVVHLGDENSPPVPRTPKTQTKTPLDRLIQASDPYPPSLQKYTDDFANRTQDDAFPPTPVPAKSTAGLDTLEAEFPLRLSFTEHSSRKF